MALTLLFFLVVRVKFNGGAMMLALAGIGFIIIGLNQAQVPGATPTLTTMIHQYTTVAVLVMFPIACFLLAPGLKARGYSGLYYYTLGTGVFFILFFSIGGYILVTRFSLVGIYERILLWNGQLWVEIVCARLIYGAIRERTGSKSRALSG